MAAELLQTLALTVLLAAAALLVMRLNRSGTRAADRARAVVREAGGGPLAVAGEEEVEQALHIRFGSLLAALGARLPLFNAKQRAEIQNQLMAIGFRQPHALSVFITLKLLMGAVGGLGGLAALKLLEPDLPEVTSLLLVLGSVQVGMMLPDGILRRRVVSRRQAIHRAVPDALDLMVICTNAGYSLAATVKRLGTELKGISPELAFELELTSHEIQMNADPVEGLRHLAERTGVESLRSLVATLIQAHQYGTPITQSLRTLARTERTTRILLLEEKGAKLAAKMTMPMMFLILPAVMLIAGGPAVLRISGGFRF